MGNYPPHSSPLKAQSIIRSACKNFWNFHRTFEPTDTLNSATHGTHPPCFGSRDSFFTGTLMALVVTNILTLTSTAFNAALSGALSSALGVTTVADLMSQRLANEERALTQAQTKLTNKKAAVRKFGTRLTSRTKRVAARSIAAIPAESVPYLGIAAVIAATGYEFYEACEA